jgi:ubiquinone/menaquinone biosynthesis C-methylase UbiE
MDDRVVPFAAVAFTNEADAYERGRPGYADAVIAELVQTFGLQPGRRALDLAAGTGKLTRQLVVSGAELVAVEPLAALRAQFRAVLPDIAVLDGTAEAIPLADESVDAVFVAQAFHWFDADRALAEITRILRPGGFLALLWNDRDDDVAWVVALDGIMHGEQSAAVAQMPGYASRVAEPAGRADAAADVAADQTDEPAGLATIAASGRFTEVTAITSRHAPETTAEAVVDAVRSRSYIGSLPVTDRDAVLQRVRALLADFPATFPMPYVTRAFWCQLLSPTSS